MKAFKLWDRETDSSSGGSKSEEKSASKTEAPN